MFAEGEHLGKSFRRSTLERGTIEGNSPVFKNSFTLLVRRGHHILILHLEPNKN